MAYDVWPTLIDEQTTPRLTAVIRDADGVGIPAASLNSLKWWLINKATDAIINGRNGTGILNANGGTVDGNGNLALDLTVLDTAMIDGTRNTEVHVAEFEFVYNTGTKTGRHTVEHTIRNLRKVP